MAEIRRLFSALQLLVLFLGVAHAIDCTNVTIASADDAAEVRSGCTTISGSLTFAKALSETINLDGVQEIEGDITHSGCEEGWDECEIPSGFTISSSTLTKVGGGIVFWYFQGLEKLEFPNLERVEGSVSLKRLHQLKTLDITNLAYLGYMVLEAGNLTTLEHNALQGFTGENKYGSVSFWAAAVKSVDSFFSYPIVANGTANQAAVTITSEYLPNVKEINFGWAKVPELWISGSGINVTLGTSRTTSMDIDSIVFKGNVTGLQRSSSVKNLTVGSFTMESDMSMENLELPFDQLSSLRIVSSDALQNIKLPEDALGWENFGLEISTCENLNLSSEYLDGEQIWYWPQGNIAKIQIAGVNVSNGFFDSFIENHANGNDTQKVLDEFIITPNPEQEMAFNCTPFSELQQRGVLPNDYSCSNVTDSFAMRAIGYTLWHYWIAFVAIAFYLI